VIGDALWTKTGGSVETYRHPCFSGFSTAETSDENLGAYKDTHRDLKVLLKTPLELTP
jgi:hypothetical protein